MIFEEVKVGLIRGLTKELMRAWISLVIAAVLLVLAISSSEASTLQSKKRQLEQVKRKLRELKYKLSYQRQEEYQIYRQLQEVWGKVAFLESELKKIEHEKKLIDNSIRKLERKLKEAEKELEDLKLTLRVQASYLYSNYIPWLVMGILGETDIDVALDRIYLLKSLISQRSSLFGLIAQKESDIRLIKRALSYRKKKLEEYEALLKKKRKLYSSSIQERQRLLEEIRSRRRQIERKVRYYERISEKIRREIRRMILEEQAKRGLVFKAGRLVWPTTSRYITSYFGYRWHPIRGAYRFHSGIDIGNYYGEPIYAAADGVVIYAGWLDGYGYTVIIDHGSGVSTLYAHCSRLLVRKGDVVVAGQPIAKIGSTGISTGPHLHFEVRIGGRPVNPLRYLY